MGCGLRKTWQPRSSAKTEGELRGIAILRTNEVSSRYSLRSSLAAAFCTRLGYCAPLGPDVKAVHSGLRSLLHHSLDRVRSGRDGIPDCCVHPAQNVVGDAQAGRRTPDADAHANEVRPQA